ncbi:hypothetical protein [uncultured Pseudoalteromonas sp.]|uniref:hypothetical protein n=1 Tax=uncultured Pseudoalteromonas sp. TaxID=114053 RepID=UPI002594C017|nr:hypothetical protein [uncultured Pseudoalteromonas sp.]
MEKSVEIQLSNKGSDLYIFFGGIAAGIAMPPFEFYNAAGILEQHKIFIRDFHQNWYQNGLEGISQNVTTTTNFINKKINEIKPEKIYFVGNSMGGFAAILFARLIGRGEVIAFAPQTFICPIERIKKSDYRWFKQVFITYLSTFSKATYFNLKKLLLEKGGDNKISIFVSIEHRLDYQHALYLKGVDGVEIYEFSGFGHGIVKYLRDSGSLPDIMSGNYNKNI